MSDPKYTFLLDEKFTVNTLKKAEATEKLTQWYNSINVIVQGNK